MTRPLNLWDDDVADVLRRAYRTAKRRGTTMPDLFEGIRAAINENPGVGLAVVSSAPASSGGLGDIPRDENGVPYEPAVTRIVWALSGEVEDFFDTGVEDVTEMSVTFRVLPGGSGDDRPTDPEMEALLDLWLTGTVPETAARAELPEQEARASRKHSPGENAVAALAAEALRPVPQLPFVLDRPHRFQVGDILRHPDVHDPRGHMVVLEQTTRAGGTGRSFPTYTLANTDTDEVETDILDTADLTLVRHRPGGAA